MKNILTILALALSGVGFADPLDQIKKSLDSGQKTERTEAVVALKNTIDDKELSNEARLEAIQLAVDMNVHECSGMLIKYIDARWVKWKSIVPFEIMFSSVDALIAFGEKTVPDLIEAIKKEDNELRQRLMSYSLLRIMKKEAALVHIEKLLATDRPPSEKKRLEAARLEIGKWSDYEAPSKK